MPKLPDNLFPGVARFPKKLTKRAIQDLIGFGVEKPLILEIGCNDGQDTGEFLQRFRGAEIRCFECDPRPIAKFKASIRNTRCHLHEIALADRNGEMTLHMSGGTTKGADRTDWDMSSSLMPPKEHLKLHPWCTFERKCQVPTRRLDDWAAEFIPGRTVDFVWLDVQGGERLVFEGGKDLFLNRTRFIYQEISIVEEYAGCWLLPDAVAAYSPSFDLVSFHEGYNALFRRRDQ